MTEQELLEPVSPASREDWSKVQCQIAELIMGKLASEEHADAVPEAGAEFEAGEGVYRDVVRGELAEVG